MNLCLGTKRDNSPCTVTVEPPQTYCWWHDPANADERKRAASRGGRRAGRGRPQVEIAEIKAILRGLADDVIDGSIETNRASVASQILNTMLRAISLELAVREQAELVGRMEQLEDAITANREARKWPA